jgi:hypothetical protein
MSSTENFEGGAGGGGVEGVGGGVEGGVMDGVVFSEDMMAGCGWLKLVAVCCILEIALVCASAVVITIRWCSGR